jgi:hypothetical protein
MNNWQRCVIVLGFIVILLLGLFPPWLIQSQPTGSERPQVNAILRPLDPNRPVTVFSQRGGEWGGRRVNASLLLIQWFLVSAVTGIVVVFLEDRRRGHASRPDE